jgi:hypothetical protein
VVQVVTGYYFVLNALIVKADCVICVVASELKEVLNYELLILTPSNFQACLIKFVAWFTFDCLRIKKIEHFFIVNLKEGT